MREVLDAMRDGDIDIFISGWYPNSRLYRNNGDFTFTDMAVSAGIVDPDQPNMSACWGDVNQDGQKDLIVQTGFLTTLGGAHFWLDGNNLANPTHNFFSLQNTTPLTNQTNNNDISVSASGHHAK
mgnify:FL=1